MHTLHAKREESARIRGKIKSIIATDKLGGHYITPAENDQPDPNLAIASILALGCHAVGVTEAQAQSEWLRQIHAGATNQARVAS